MRESMRDAIREMMKPERVIQTYKEMFDGITDDEAAQLAAAFTATITTGKDKRGEFKHLLAEAKRKYPERESPSYADDFPDFSDELQLDF